MIPVKIIRKTKATAAATAAAAQPIDTGLLLPRTIFDDLFQKVLITPPVIDDDGNVTTPARYAIQANYDLYSIGGISGYRHSGKPAGGTAAGIDIEQFLTDGTPVAAINGVTIYAPPPAAGASSWAELTGKPAWLTDTPPAVSVFQNDAGYITAAALAGYPTTNQVATLIDNTEQTLKDWVNAKNYATTTDITDSEQTLKDWVKAKNYATQSYVDAAKVTGYAADMDTVGQDIRLIDEEGNIITAVIAPYAQYTGQLGATGSTGAVNIYGEAELKNGSLKAAGNITATYDITTTNGNLSVAGSATVQGESRLNGYVYLPDAYTFFGSSGIYVRANLPGQYPYGDAAYIGIHESYTGTDTVATVNLDGTVRLSHCLAINQDPDTDASLRVGGLSKLDFLTIGGAARPDNYWFASPNGYFGDPTSGTYTAFGDGGIELSHPTTPYIDFHYNKSTADYTSRLIAAEDGVLMIDSATADPALRIGYAYLRYDAINNALYVTGRDGAQVNFYATGGLAAYSAIGSVTQLANLQLTGQLRARSAAFTGMVQASSILLDNFTLDTNNEYFEIRYLGLDYAENQLVLDVYGDIYSEGYLYVNGKTWLNETYIGSQASTYKITGIYADGINVYITINGKKYKLANA